MKARQPPAYADSPTHLGMPKVSAPTAPLHRTTIMNHLSSSDSHPATSCLEAPHERRWTGRAEPLVGQLSSRAQQLARQGMDLAANAGARAQESWARYADVTTGYVVRQPVRSVLVAAAVGAGLALLIAASSRRRD